MVVHGTTPGIDDLEVEDLAVDTLEARLEPRDVVDLANKFALVLVQALRRPLLAE
jgi:hypothetical protein